MNDLVADTLERLMSQGDSEQALSLMESWFEIPGGPAEIVSRYVGSPQPALVNMACFLLARGVSHGKVGVGLVREAVRRFRSEDEAAIINLLSAVQLAAMLDSWWLLPPELLPLLVRTAKGSELVRSSVVAAVARLHASGDLRAADPAQRAELRRLLSEMEVPPGSLLERELPALGPFLSTS